MIKCDNTRSTSEDPLHETVETHSMQFCVAPGRLSGMKINGNVIIGSF